MIGTGSGIAPFLSLLQYKQKDPNCMKIFNIINIKVNSDRLILCSDVETLKKIMYTERISKIG